MVGMTDEASAEVLGLLKDAGYDGGRVVAAMRSLIGERDSLRAAVSKSAAVLRDAGVPCAAPEHPALEQARLPGAVEALAQAAKVCGTRHDEVVAELRQVWDVLAGVLDCDGDGAPIHPVGVPLHEVVAAAIDLWQPLDPERLLIELVDVLDHYVFTGGTEAGSVAVSTLAVIRGLRERSLTIVERDTLDERLAEIRAENMPENIPGDDAAAD